MNSQENICDLSEASPPRAHFQWQVFWLKFKISHRLDLLVGFRDFFFKVKLNMIVFQLGQSSIWLLKSQRKIGLDSFWLKIRNETIWSWLGMKVMIQVILLSIRNCFILTRDSHCIKFFFL